jgi:hypothetical protein
MKMTQSVQTVVQLPGIWMGWAGLKKGNISMTHWLYAIFKKFHFTKKYHLIKAYYHDYGKHLQANNFFG